MDWTMTANDVTVTKGFRIEPTGNVGEYALYKVYVPTGRPYVHAEMVGTVEECQQRAEELGLSPTQTGVSNPSPDVTNEE